MYYRGYQKLFHVLLCEDDEGTNEGNGIPVKRASYSDCLFLEGSGIKDNHGLEIFEGDIVRLRRGNQELTEVVENIPDMFKSRNLHPLQSLLEKAGISDNLKDIEFQIMGNIFESPIKA